MAQHHNASANTPERGGENGWNVMVYTFRDQLVFRVLGPIKIGKWTLMMTLAELIKITTKRLILCVRKRGIERRRNRNKQDKENKGIRKEEAGWDIMK